MFVKSTRFKHVCQLLLSLIVALTEFTRRQANLLFRSHVNGSPSFVRKCRKRWLGYASDPTTRKKKFLIYTGPYTKTVNANNWGLSDFILLCFFLFLLELLMTYNGQLPFAAAKL